MLEAMTGVDGCVERVASGDLYVIVVGDDGVGMDDLAADPGGRRYARDPAGGHWPEVFHPEINGD